MKIVSLVNMKGGVAKTTMAVNLADCLATRHGLRVLLIDIDPQFNATQCLVSAEAYKEHIQNSGHTIVDLFDDSPRAVAGSTSGSSTLEPLEVEQISPLSVKENLDLLPGALELYRLEMTGGQGRENRVKIYTNMLEEQDRYDVVIIDTPPTPSAWMSSALIASDSYIVPVKPEPLSVTGIDLLRNVVSRVTKNYALSLNCGGVIFTIAEENTIVFRQAKKFVDENDYWKGKRYAQHLPKKTVIARNQGEQKLILASDDQELKLALSKITSEFVKRMKLDD